MLERVLPLFGLIVMLAICWGVSTDRKAALRRWDLIIWGLGLQFLFAFLVLKVPVVANLFLKFNDAFMAVINCTNDGAEFVFGNVVPFSDFVPDFATTAYVDAAVAHGADPTLPKPKNQFFIIAFMVLPSIIFFSALMSILYHIGVLQFIVKGIAVVMMKTLKTSGAETLSASANIFVGQTEAPLMVKPYLARMTKSELMTVMTGGFATVAGGVMAAYVMMLADVIPNVAGHLMAASIMSAPAALLFGKIMVPETEEPETGKTLHVSVERPSANLVDAATIGTTDGIKLAINVGGMLIAFLALIAFADLLLKSAVGLVMTDIPTWVSLRGISGYIFAIQAWLMGITDWSEALRVGQLMGVKLIANEFVAYLDLAAMGTGENPLSQRSMIIASYALCGFANVGSIGIQIGGLAAIAPERRVDLSRLALRAMFAGTFAANATACVAAVLL